MLIKKASKLANKYRNNVNKYIEQKKKKKQIIKYNKQRNKTYLKVKPFCLTFK